MFFGPVAPMMKAPASAAVAFSYNQVANMAIWWDFSDITRQYTDVAMTTPVTTLGQKIAGHKTKGTEYNFIQNDVARRPTWAQSPVSGLSAQFISPNNLECSPDTAAAPNTRTLIVVYHPQSGGGSVHDIITGDLAAGDRGLRYSPSVKRWQVGGMSIDVNDTDAFRSAVAIRRDRGTTKSLRIIASNSTGGLHDLYSETTQSTSAHDFDIIGTRGTSDTSGTHGYLKHIVLYHRDIPDGAEMDQLVAHSKAQAGLV